jgi:hypothetical protein
MEPRTRRKLPKTKKKEKDFLRETSPLANTRFFMASVPLTFNTEMLDERAALICLEK